MTTTTNKFKLLTFYKFVSIKNPYDEIIAHRKICESLGIKGRIYIGEEGINATLTCELPKLDEYLNYIYSHALFNDIEDIETKSCFVHSHQFRKLIVRYRNEIVALGEKVEPSDVHNLKIKMPVEQFKYIMENESDNYLILDMRNNYEYELGHFKDAIPANTAQFKDLKAVVEHYKTQFNNKNIIMYCTGGIRCEKAAVLLNKHGFEGVQQLDGGIVKYLNTINDNNWLGNLYTFDDRVSCDIDNTEIISKSHYSGKTAKHFHNCRYGFCNRQFIALQEEYQYYGGFCSQQCYKDAYNSLNIRNVPFDPMNYKELRGKIKQDPTKREEIENLIRSHLETQIDYKIIPHNEPKAEKMDI